MSDKKIVIVDGFALIFRAFYAFISNPLRTSTGFPTSAIFGFLRMLLKVIKDMNPDYIVVALESEKKTFRSEIYPEYKANRDEPPDDLKKQIPVLIELIKDFEIPNISVEGYEADDVIATLAAKLKERKDIEVLILSSDKDLMQLVGDNVKCVTSTRGISDITVIDEKGVEEKYGVPPNQMLEFLALTGDSADNIPGITGVGPKTAAKLLKQHGDIETIYKHIDQIKGKMKDKVARGRENVDLSKQLLKLETNLDLSTDLDNYKLPDFKSKKAIDTLKEYELDSLLKDPVFSGSKEIKDDKKIVSEQKTDNLKKDYKKATYKSILKKSDLDALINEINTKQFLSIDTETTSENPIEAELIGISLCIDPKEAFYIPLKHGVDKDFTNDYLLNKIKEIVENDKIKLIGQNIKYDYIVLKNIGITMNNVFFDTMIASYVLDPSRGRHNMDFLANYFLGYETVKYSSIVNVKKGETLLDVDFEKVVEYASEDAEITFKLYEKFKELLEEKDLKDVFYGIDMPLVKILGEMEFAGVLIDFDYMKEMSDSFGNRVKELEDSIYSKVGSEFNVNSTQQLAKVLFEDLNLPPQKKTKTGYSTNSQVLEKLKDKHPIIEDIIEYRKLIKLKTTYLDALPPLIFEKTNRIHASFNQCVTATGRLSSSSPNLQNIPIRGETGGDIRKCFIAPDNYEIISADYSQIELRILAHVTGDNMLVNAYEKNIDIHKQTASLIYDVSPEEVTDEMRANAKTINFAVIYGRGARNLSSDLKITYEEAVEFRDRYFEKYSGVRDYIELVKEKSANSGFVKTLFGRIRYLTGYASSNNRDIAQAERIAFNTIIQGTAADIIKIAMHNICTKLKEKNLDARLIIQVHDELVFEGNKNKLDDIKNLIKSEMENAVNLNVPLTVNIGSGDNWDEAH